MARQDGSVPASVVVSHIRAAILSGKCRPGSRLPVRETISRETGASRVTVQRAFDALRRQGFIESSRGSGTFVAERPPHLYSCALIFGPMPSRHSGEWNGFYEALWREAGAIDRDEPGRLKVFQGIGDPTHVAERSALAEQVANHMLAGLIFVTPPASLRQPALTEVADVPCVTLTNTGSQSAMPVVTLDRSTYLGMAAESLVRSGRKRVAVVVMSAMSRASCEPLRRDLEALGLECRPEWIQGAALHHAEWAFQSARLLFSGRAAERPDALLVMDDNLVPHATAGLLAAGVRVPTDVEVIAHANFPWPTPSVVPARRLGYDARAVLMACIDVITRLRGGEQVQPITLAPAIWGQDPALAHRTGSDHEQSLVGSPFEQEVM